MKKNAENKVKQPMSLRTKWIITVLLMIIALGLVIVCIAEGLFSFQPGVVKANDDVVVESTDAVSDEDEEEDLADEYTVFISEGNGGTANPSGSVTVDAWGSITVSFTPNEGYEIGSVVVDGSDVGAVTTYTLSYITSDHTVMVTFEKIPEPTPEPTEEPLEDAGE